jgi:hypothetical protein
MLTAYLSPEVGDDSAGPIWSLDESAKVYAVYIITAGSIQLERFDPINDDFVDVVGAPAYTESGEVTHELIAGIYRYQAANAGDGDHVYIDGGRIREVTDPTA